MNEYVPDVSKWLVPDMQRAEGTLTEICSNLYHVMLATLMTGEFPKFEDPERSQFTAASVELSRELKAKYGEEAVERFIETIDMAARVSIVYMGAMIDGMVAAGLILPDPDRVVIPDEVPGDWGTE